MKVSPLREPETQTERVRRFIRDHDAPTAMEIAHGCSPWVSNPRARISDLRAEGYVIEKVRRSDGQTGFRLVEPGQRTLFGEVA